MRQAFVSDCEGPISKNDNAYEITSHLVPKGSRLYSVISRYDDLLADILKRPNHKAGCTLKLVLPFLKAYGATDQKMQELSAAKLALISDAKATLQHVRSLAPAFVVSTSYEHYIKALCETMDFPFENTYCTKVVIDNYDILEHEKNQLRTFAAEIVRMRVIEIPQDAKSAQDLSIDDQETIQRLDEIFWKEIEKLEIGRLYSEVNPMGGGEKAEAIEDIVRKLKIRLSNVMYVGDSITDEEAFKIVKKGGGLTVSFNGNQYAVRNAEVALLSESSIPTAMIADIFTRFGKGQVLKLAEDWSMKALKKSPVSPNLLERFFKSEVDKSCKVEIINRGNVEELARKSSEFRLRVRGEAVGSLG